MPKLTASQQQELANLKTRFANSDDQWVRPILEQIESKETILNKYKRQFSREPDEAVRIAIKDNLDETESILSDLFKQLQNEVYKIDHDLDRGPSPVIASEESAAPPAVTEQSARSFAPTTIQSRAEKQDGQNSGLLPLKDALKKRGQEVMAQMGTKIKSSTTGQGSESTAASNAPESKLRSIEQTIVGVAEQGISIAARFINTVRKGEATDNKNNGPALEGQQAQKHDRAAEKQQLRGFQRELNDIVKEMDKFTKIVKGKPSQGVKDDAVAAFKYCNEKLEKLYNKMDAVIKDSATTKKGCSALMDLISTTVKQKNKSTDAFAKAEKSYQDQVRPNSH